MGRTYNRTHLPDGEYRARRNTRRRLRTQAERGTKTTKAIRTNAKANLRKEYR